MKTLLTSIFFVVGSFILNAQDGKTALCSSKATLVKGVSTGIIEIKLHEAITKEDVEKYASYYKNIFTVSFDEKSRLASIKMLQNTSANRMVILRFLGANQVQNVIVEGKLFTLNDFYENYLK
jgi:hypothetical protein